MLITYSWMEHLPCPACHTPLPPEATGCHICLRPRSKQEIMRAYARLREEKARRRILPIKILVVALILGGAAKLSRDHQTEIKAAAATAREAVNRWSEEMTDAKRYAKRPADAPAAVSEPEVEVTMLPPAPKPPPAANVWRVSGLVYDLNTLQPIPNSEVRFFRERGSSLTTKTDKTGRYEVDLVRGAGWHVSVTAPDRRKGQVVDINPSYRERDPEARRAASMHLSDSDLGPSPVNWSRKRSQVTLNLVAVPHAWSQH